VPAPSTFRYLVRDAETRAPLREVSLCEARGGKILATTGDDGIAAGVPAEIQDLVFARAGYLLGMQADFSPDLEAVLAASRATGVLEVKLFQDRYSIPFRFRFLTSSGTAASGVSYEVICLQEPPPLGGSLPKGLVPAGGIVAPELLASWRQHQMLATLPRFASALATRYHFGVQSHGASYRCDADSEIRFCEVGPYAIEARDSRGEIARLEFEVGIGQTAPLEVRLSAGAYFVGQVVDAVGKPIPEVIVADVSTDRGHSLPFVLGRSDSGGNFKLGPLGQMPIPLSFSHPEHEPTSLTPRRPGGEPFRVALVPRAKESVVGIVRERPGLAAVPGASVTLRDSNAVVVAKAVSDAQGRFELRSAVVDLQLVVEAKGYSTYVEVVGGGAGVLTCDLLPADPQRRFESGLTGLVCGTVVDSRGKVVPNALVVLLPETHVPMAGVPGRRIIRGGVLDLALRSTSEVDGSFTIEHDRSGAARILVVGMRTEDGIPVTLALGTRSPPLTLRPPQ